MNATSSPIPVDENFVHEAIWDRDVLDCLEHMKNLVAERDSFPAAAIRQVWSTLYQLSQRSTMVERAVMYWRAYLAVQDRFPVLEYIILNAMMEVDNILEINTRVRAANHTRIAELLRVHPEVSDAMGGYPAHHERLAFKLGLDAAQPFS